MSANELTSKTGMSTPDPAYFPLTPERWTDFEHLFGVRGACGGCWCMYWRLSHATYEFQAGEMNRFNMKAIVLSGEVPGILAYQDGIPVGWCAIAPRQAYIRLANSRLLKPVDDQPVWSIVCFFVARTHRRQGVTRGLIGAALDFARQQGAKIVEAYPTIPKANNAPPVFIFTGVASAFLNAGFVEVARRSENRPILRFHL